ncbi:MAG: hypothetical protein ABIH46_13750 [Chloroflexota bacterium]
MPTEVYDYLKLGIDLTNQYMDLSEAFKAWPKERTVVLRVCNPHPEVQSFFRDWLKMYATDQLRDGAVVEEPFNIYLDTEEDQYQIRLNRGTLESPTVEVLISESLFWDIASRGNTIYTAFITGKPMVINSKEGYDLRDLAHLDVILGLIHKSLIDRGIDITSLVRS